MSFRYGVEPMFFVECHCSDGVMAREELTHLVRHL